MCSCSQVDFFPLKLICLQDDVDQMETIISKLQLILEEKRTLQIKPVTVPHNIIMIMVHSLVSTQSQGCTMVFVPFVCFY